MTWQLVPNDEGVRRFKLSDSFVEEYAQKEVPWGYDDLSYFTYKRTYARKRSETIPNAKGTEEWYETCRRVIEGMFSIEKRHMAANGLVGNWDNAKAQRAAKEAYDRLFNLKWTPPGRGLWMMGTRYVEERTGAGLFNCAFVSTIDIDEKFSKPFTWAMDCLMLGIGVGFDTKGVGKISVKLPDRQPRTKFIVPDTREGWVEAVRIVIDAYLQGIVLPEFDYTEVRPYGALIKGFGGTASGPGPLKELIDSLKAMLDAIIGEEITTTVIVDIMNMIGRCVVAGNVRRSAELAMGQYDDQYFLELKDPDKHGRELESWRWASNNSIEAQVGMDYRQCAELTMKNGEPGYIWLENARNYGRMKDGRRPDDLKVMGFNPCVEQQLESYELCCLVETYPGRHESFEDYKRTLKYAYLYAKTVTLVNTQWPETNAIMLKNRRIGLSMSGVAQSMSRLGRREFFNWCDEAYGYIQALDHKYSDWLCVPKSKRTTSVKPSGTVSLLAGAWPGIHFPEDEYYIRRVRIAASHPLVDIMEASGYPIEDCIYSPNTKVISFPIKEEFFEKSKRDVSMWEQLEIAAQMQYWWADNSVSATVTFNVETEGHQIKDALQLYETRLKAVSFLPHDTHGYKQAPYESITAKDWAEITQKINRPDLSDNNHQGEGEVYCDGDKCEIKL